ncbi:PucR family transcriptional regulator [Paeniglutamicibacter sp. NPDC091659]|uniref:PucR family transcriptional regulator n=1 Tax=Paeniglutamicibacter sp. NPDC091659 TaxID=3364389 RepID=UPI003817A114
MSMTVKELLAEPHLGLGILAGEAGLDNSITWSHTSDLPNLWEWISGGVLLMTNGLSIPADASSQVEMARALVTSGASGLAVGEKMHAPAFTDEFLEACDSLPLPLINVPYPLPFIAISRSIAEAALLEESRRVKQTARIYDLLRKATTPGETWSELLAGIGGELSARLFVVDRRCLHPWQPGDRGLPKEAIRQVAEASEKSEVGSRHFHWSQDGGRSVLLMDIPTHGHAMLVVLPESESTPDGVVLLHAATVLGLGLSRSALAMEGRYRTGGEFLLQAFGGRMGAAEAARRLADFSLPEEGARVLSLASRPGFNLPEVHRALWRHGVNSVCVDGGERLHLLVSAETSVESLLHVIDADISLGLSTSVGASDLQRALRESVWALGMARAGGSRHALYSTETSWFGLNGYREGEALVHRLLGPLLEYDRTHGAELMATLGSYLKNQRSAQKAATELFTHRQTVIYRIRKIAELTGLDLAETASVAQLWLAVQARDSLEVEGLAGGV